MVVHVLSVLFTATMVYVASPGSSLFSWHPFLMAAAFSLLMLQAVVVFSPESSFFSSAGVIVKRNVHWMLQLVSIVCASVGFAVVYFNKELNGREHFTTYHAKFGLTTAACTLATSAFGIAAYFSLRLKDYIKPIHMKIYHSTAGMICFLLAMTTIVLATYSNWFFNRFSPKKNIYINRFVFWTPIIMAICVARQVTQACLPLIMDEHVSSADKKRNRIARRLEAKLKRQREGVRSSEHSDFEELSGSAEGGDNEGEDLKEE